jgi:hypothetical protein
MQLGSNCGSARHIWIFFVFGLFICCTPVSGGDFLFRPRLVCFLIMIPLTIPISFKLISFIQATKMPPQARTPISNPLSLLSSPLKAPSLHPRIVLSERRDLVTQAMRSMQATAGHGPKLYRTPAYHQSVQTIYHELLCGESSPPPRQSRRTRPLELSQRAEHLLRRDRDLARPIMV